MQPYIFFLLLQTLKKDQVDPIKYQGADWLGEWIIIVFVPIATDWQMLHRTPISLVSGIFLIFLHWLPSNFFNVPFFLFKLAFSKTKIMIDSITPKIKTVNRKTILKKVICIGFPSSWQFCLGCVSCSLHIYRQRMISVNVRCSNQFNYFIRGGEINPHIYLSMPWGKT